MARYYFDIHDGMLFVRDDEGTEFKDLDTALRGAVQSAGELGRNKQAKGDTGDVVITVRDEENQRIFTVTASMRIEQHPVPPQPSRPQDLDSNQQPWEMRTNSLG
ncbi:hypothetical protein [Microvirga sp. TS319]|uniref:DUF6894 family protein n=1 Tax=Microvirga sp. TS319 TaxID=3241165 RepID=UPI00351A4BB3